MKLIGIAAVADNGVIGHTNTIPWQEPEDLQHFKAVTTGHTVVMGRATFDSIGRALPGRRTIVLTRDRSWHLPGVDAAHSLGEALMMASATLGRREVFIAGGAQIYAAAWDLLGHLIISHIHQTPDGDTFLPAIDPDLWVRVSHVPGDRFSKSEYLRRRCRSI